MQVLLVLAEYERSVARRLSLDEVEHSVADALDAPVRDGPHLAVAEANPPAEGVLMVEDELGLAVVRVMDRAPVLQGWRFQSADMLRHGTTIEPEDAVAVGAGSRPEGGEGA